MLFCYTAIVACSKAVVKPAFVSSGKAVSPVKKLFTPTFVSPKKGLATVISKKDSSEDYSSEDDDDSEDEPNNKSKFLS